MQEKVKTWYKYKNNLYSFFFAKKNPHLEFASKYGIKMSNSYNSDKNPIS